MAQKPYQNKRWITLDNAAKIYPAARRRHWMALFRLSAEVSDPVDPAILAEAQRIVLRRFPVFAFTLKRGLFWYYLEQNDAEPAIGKDVNNPCALMNLKENNGFLFRVRYYGRRIAVEIFHALSDGSGGLCFLETLVAEYLRLRYGADIPRGKTILDCNEVPAPDEMEDAYVKYAKSVTRTRREPNAFFIRGTDEPHHLIHITTGIIPVKEVIERAKQKEVTLTEYLTAVMIMAVDRIQRQSGRPERRMKPVKVCVPINLRRFYPTNTMRNFASYVNPGIDPRFGQHSFDEVLQIVHHHMGSEVTEKMLNAKFATNVQSENIKMLRVMPLFIKNAALKLSFNLVGDRKSSTSISNLGVAQLPEAMAKYVTRMDLLLGPLSRNRVVCAALTYKQMLHISFTRTIGESMLEKEFFRYLVRLGIPVKIESNEPW